MAKTVFNHGDKSFKTIFAPGSSSILATLIFIIGSSVIYQTFAIPRRGIWGDEVVRLQISFGGNIPPETLNCRPSDLSGVLRMLRHFPSYQPLYYLMQNRILHLTGAFTETDLKLLNVYISAVSAAGIFAWGRRFLSGGAAIFATLFFAFNGWGLMHDLQIREYPLLLCLLIWNAYCFQRLCEQRGRRCQSFSLLAGHAITGMLALFTSSWALFPMLCQPLVVLMLRRSRISTSLRVLYSFGLIAMAWAPWMAVTFTSNYRKSVEVIFDHNSPTFGLLAHRMVTGFRLLLAYQSGSTDAVSTLVAWAVLLLALFGISRILALFISAGPSRQLVVSWCFIFFAFQVSYFFCAQPLSTWPRYYIVYLPALALISAELFDFCARRFQERWHAQRISAILLLSFGCLYAGNQAAAYWKDPFKDQSMDLRAVAQGIASYAGPRDLFLANSGIVSQGIGFYLPSRSLQMSNWTESDQLVQRSDLQHVWLVLIPDKGEIPPLDQVLSAAQQQGFTVGYQKSSHQLRVFRLDRSLMRTESKAPHQPQ
jgi:uncharacterized membrane protein